jgi:hypothetical protein
MWRSEIMVYMYRGENPIELVDIGHTSSETFAYDEVGLQAWQRRTRVMHTVPDNILNIYMPLASKTFQRLCLHKVNESSSTPNIHVIGDVGMGFALDESRIPCMSVEAAALYQLVQTPNRHTPVPNWLKELEQTWTHQMSLFMFDSQTGWRGCFAEHRLWSSLLLQINSSEIKTPYAKPNVRAWFPVQVLNDFKECVGSDLALKIATKIAELGFDGAPDLILYHENRIWCVEVKSANDKLKPHQLRMMQELSKFPNVTCQICCPKSALKRFASVMLSNNDSDESDD